ncbi:uncharacterized protein LOC111390997 [Olea europaea var. sylvestris]|uniref:uncharacterized protein LOC111390997 n=1 Tax=Olea europaea var. sylvestris TaxID=158386 RepID=UPI000C1D8688|nr:uncharacterized protein LOC111390997 [Olea europaea var. sylvestris]
MDATCELHFVNLDVSCWSHSVSQSCKLGLLVEKVRRICELNSLTKKGSPSWFLEKGLLGSVSRGYQIIMMRPSGNVGTRKNTQKTVAIILGGAVGIGRGIACLLFVKSTFGEKPPPYKYGG